MDRIATHEKCLMASLSLYAMDDPDSEYDTSAVRLAATTCYLCGEPLADGQVHVDHVHPRSDGGSHQWLNVGAAHARCNLSKGSKVGITDEQQIRLVAQHEELRRRKDRLDVGIWFQELTHLIEDDPESFIDDSEWFREAVDDYYEEGDIQPPTGIVEFVAMMLDDRTMERDTESKRRLGEALDVWRTARDQWSAEWDKAHEGMTQEEIRQEAFKQLSNLRVSAVGAVPEPPKKKRFGFGRKSSLG